MFKQFPPRGYLGEEFPLHHDIEFNFQLNAEDETKNSTIIPILLQDEGIGTQPKSVQVNPKNDTFEVNTGFQCYPDSIIPKIALSYRCALTKGAIETDLIRSLSLNIMPIHTAFLSRLDAEDTKTTTDCENLLELTHETTDKQCYPLYSTVKLSNGFTAPTDYPGLTTTQVIESVAFDKETFFDAMQYYTNANMLKTMVGGMRTVLLKRDYPYSHYSNNYNYPIVKFMNHYAFCGILFHLPQVGQIDQYGLAADTTNIPHINISGKIRFPEWNKALDQDAE